MRVRLRPLRIGDEAEALRATAELEQDGVPFLLDRDPNEPWATYLHRLERYRRRIDLPIGYVPATFLAAVVMDILIGRVSIRHELNDS